MDQGDSTGTQLTVQRFYIPAIDGLRFFAFFAVFLIHLPEVPIFENSKLQKVIHSIQSDGWVGVDLFFVISAFLMTSILLIESKNFMEIHVRKFYLRRIFRIWPLYFFVVILAFTIAPLLSTRASPPIGSHDFIRLVKIHLPGLVLFIYNYMNIVSQPDNVLVAPLWSISAEEQFYLILPLFVGAMLKASARGWNAAIAAIFLFGCAVKGSLWIAGVNPLMIWVSPFARPDALLIGTLIAYIRFHGKWPTRWRHSSGAALFLAIVIFAIVIVSPHHFDRLNDQIL